MFFGCVLSIIGQIRAAAFVALSAAVFLCAGYSHATVVKEFPRVPDQEPGAKRTPEGRFKFRHYGVDEGLLNGSIKQVLEDPKGFVWVATDDGMYRFDGYRFDKLGREHGLDSTQIELSLIEKKGVLWAATLEGTHHWDGKKFNKVSVAEGLPNSRVFAMKDSPFGLLLGMREGLFAQSNSGSFQRLVSWPGKTVSTVAVAAEGSGVWVGEWEGVARIFLGAGIYSRRAKWQEYELPVAQRSERIDSILVDAQGRVWARSINYLSVLDVGADRFVLVKTPIDISNSIDHLFPDGAGGFYVMTRNGLLQFTGEAWRVLGENQGMISAATRATLVDDSGHLWIGTNGLGLYRLLGAGILRGYGKDGGFPSDTVWAICRTPDDTLWLGTDHGFVYWDHHQWRTVAGTQNVSARTVTRTYGGQFFFGGTPANEVWRYTPDTKKLERFSISPDNTASRINRLLIDEQENLWAATWGGGLYRADARDPKAPLKFQRVRIPGGTDNELVSDIYQDSQKRIWASAEHGLALYVDNKWQRFSKLNGFRHDHVSAFRELTNGDFIFAYREPFGISQARYEAGKWQFLKDVNTSSGLSSDKIYLFGEDHQGRIWAGGSNGVNIIVDDVVNHVAGRNGLISDDLNNMAFFAESDGTVWLGTSQGLARVDTQKYKDRERVQANARFVEISLGGEQYLASETGVVMPHDRSTFAARFSTFDFGQAIDFEYRTTLIGHDSEAVISASPDVRYSNLPHGDYQFEVSARRKGHLKWGPAQTFNFSIDPAWWQSWWAYTLLFLSLSGLLAWAYMLRIGRLRKRNERLKRIVANRTRALVDANEMQQQVNQQLSQRNTELSQANERLSEAQGQLVQSEKMASIGQLAAGMAHEINTPISYVHSNLKALRSYVQDILAVLAAFEEIEKNLGTQKLDLAPLKTLKRTIDLPFIRGDIGNIFEECSEGITRIERIVKDLRDFSYLDDSRWQEVDLHKGLESTLNIVRGTLQGKTEIVREFDDEMPLVRCMPFQINQVFLNVIINASQAMTDAGELRICTGHDHDEVWVCIADTGPGIPAYIVDRIFEPFFTTKAVGEGTGLGLWITYSIVKAHGGSIDVESELGKGTRFTVRLPIKGHVVAEI